MKENSKRKKARALLSRSGYKTGGHVKGGEAAKDVHKHESHMHAGKPKTKLKDGGHAHGHKPKHRADKKHRGKPHTQINIVNGAHKPEAVPVPKPIPVPVPAGGPGMAAPPPGAPPPMPMPPPDQSGGMGGPGPMGLKKGGRAKATASNSQRDKKGGMPMGHFKRGGKTYPIKDGSGGGEARLQKAKAYGA